MTHRGKEFTGNCNHSLISEMLEGEVNQIEVHSLQEDAVRGSCLRKGSGGSKSATVEKLFQGLLFAYFGKSLRH